VILRPGELGDSGITDSKKLRPGKREALYDLIYRQAVSVGIGIVDAGEIDRTDILKAALASMAAAVDNLYPCPDFLLIDGCFPISSAVSQQTIVGGDSRSISVAAASIVAKVTRDRLMLRYHLEYPDYGFDRHKGYPTRNHRTAIERFGICPIHRRSFRGVRPGG
jgi:ribonuclease HII